MAQCKGMDAGTIDGIAKFIVFTKIVDTEIRTLGWADITANERRNYSKKLPGDKFPQQKISMETKKKWEGIVERDALLLV
jgi:hypothetical protein